MTGRPKTSQAHRARATTSLRDQMGTPLRLLVWLLILCAGLGIYRLAEAPVNRFLGVLLLFIFGAVIAYLLTPVVDQLQRLPVFRSHRTPAALSLYVLLLLTVIGLGFAIGPPMVHEAQHVPDLIARFQGELQRWGISVDLRAFENPTSTDLGAQLGLVTGIVGWVINVALVMVISIYLLVEGRSVVATLRNVFPEHTRAFDFILLATGATVGSYVRGQLLMSLIMGLYTWVVMTLIGVNYALVLGILAFILEFIPLLGAALAMALAVAVALLQSPTLALEAAGLGLLGHAIEAYVIGPRISGRVTQLHPLVAMGALLVGGEVGGIFGALFAVPAAAIANVLLGAAYRSRQGAEALSTHSSGAVEVENLPRLGEEISVNEDETAAG